MRFIKENDENDEKEKDTDIIFSCQCGDYHYIKLAIFEEDNDEFMFCVLFVEQPGGFWERLKFLFKEEGYVKEIILSNEDVKCLIENSKKYLDKIVK